ncbi:V-type ATP synthase subunit C [Eubacterium multiforme]|uniref:V/A-type H+-transporting ATPase subunit C n=1 Tax=Eubacterium multiforme TaxID=83339 RepID=A0ABT9UQC1_9FIRM|nr:V-type ATP synthase subunit C [Eubacterium multiforme]MDQ0148502.1 V/A-type H+-transporting ATPase subunit C [Eubacterium multiforme]
MNSMEFTQVIPRLRVLETRLLDKAKIDRMIDGDSSNEAIKVLQESEYANVMTGVKRPEDYEMVLARELKRIYELMYDASPSKTLIDIMSIKYDYHNVKVILKGMFLKKDFSDMLIPVGKEDTALLKHSIENNNLGDLPKIMRSGIEEAKEDFEATKDPQKIDIILDNAMFKEMKEIAKKLDDRFVDKYVRVLIDSTNIKTLLRVKKQNKDRDFLGEVLIKGGAIDEDTLISLLNDAPENISNKLAFTDYGEMIKVGIESYTKTGSASLLEKLIDNYLMDMMKEAKFIPFGVEPVLAYIYAKETEIKVIRIIMVGKLNNISGEVIRERLRDIYV